MPAYIDEECLPPPIFMEIKEEHISSDEHGTDDHHHHHHHHHNNSTIHESTSSDQLDVEVGATLVPQLLTNAKLPKSLQGVPVFCIGGEEVIFVAHLLTRILKCTCRAKKQFGLFRCKKFSQYRRQLSTRAWRMTMQKSEEYSVFSSVYGLSRFKEPSSAITLEGLKVWHSCGKMEAFVNREADKCASGCVGDKCTCHK